MSLQSKVNQDKRGLGEGKEKGGREEKYDIVIAIRQRMAGPEPLTCIFCAVWVFFFFLSV